ncbi:4-diphosphocytidyl-2-C-methyl-D-erythritol kinase [hydrothermal vent metagenome]|uniref:4-(cytidine 5'-diphospho)-2-C-methyl-D-erythritol kinase n=1 Tax=hydrothermal vent metagenome TaxID=652676 RepID=A0A3B1D361_9ZZZZ
MNSITLQSPAKLNLYLKVLNKRVDGFHNIETLFERINLFDDICFKSNASGKIKITCNHPHVPIGPKNLVYKVAQLFQQECGVTQGVDVCINKRIPVAAGLAGGSSNAATALKGLNKVWKLNLSQKQLLAYAARLGSDISFFLHDASWAVGQGRGEQIEKVDIKTSLWHVIVVPKIKMYSWKVYGGLNLKLTKKNEGVNILFRYLRKGNFLEVGRRLTNDLESEIIRISPNLLKLKQKLSDFNICGTLISGSGPSVFGITQTQKQAEEIKIVLDKRFSQVYVVKTL